MQYSDTTTGTGIIQLCEKFCNFPVAGITGVTALMKEFTLYANQVNREVWPLIYDAYGGWQYDDSNQTDLPIATCTVTSAQTTYALPTGSYSVRHVEVKDEGGIWHKLNPVTTEQISDGWALSEFEKTDGEPRYYTLLGNTIRLLPATNYTQAASLKVHFDRGSHDFAYDDTTATPGFVAEFHNIVPTGASMYYWFSKPQGNDAYQKLSAEYEKIKRKIVDYYSRKFSEKFPPRIMVRDYLKDNV